MKRLTTIRTLQCPCCDEELLVDVTHYVDESWKDKGGEQFTIVRVKSTSEEETEWIKSSKD